MKVSLPPGVTRAVLTYGPAFVGPAIWAYSRFPGRLAWATDAYGKMFGYLAAFYDDWTRVEGYGEPLDAALLEIPGIPSRILDLATGTGFVARRMKRLYPSAKVTGVDISEAMISVAQHDAVADGIDVTFEVADTSSLPFEDGAFDLVLMQNSIPFPAEMMRVVAPGGRLVFAVSFAGPWGMLAWNSLSRALLEAGATEARARRAGAGFYGVAFKSEA